MGHLLHNIHNQGKRGSVSHVAQHQSPQIRSKLWVKLRVIWCLWCFELTWGKRKMVCKSQTSVFWVWMYPYGRVKVTSLAIFHSSSWPVTPLLLKEKQHFLLPCFTVFTPLSRTLVFGLLVINPLNVSRYNICNGLQAELPTLWGDQTPGSVLFFFCPL